MLLIEASKGLHEESCIGLIGYSVLKGIGRFKGSFRSDDEEGGENMEMDPLR